MGLSNGRDLLLSETIQNLSVEESLRHLLPAVAAKPIGIRTCRTAGGAIGWGLGFEFDRIVVRTTSHNFNRCFAQLCQNLLKQITCRNLAGVFIGSRVGNTTEAASVSITRTRVEPFDSFGH